MGKNQIQLFEDRQIRTAWNEKEEKWYFSVVDVVGVLSDSKDPRRYWSVLKTRLKKEGNESTTNCSQLKMLSSDGKMYKTDVADLEQMFRIIQSVPSPKAEPFKQWMANVAAQRIDQLQDPELSINQAIEDYRRLGYPEKWINQRIKSIEYRKNLTDEWKRSGIRDTKDYATLTDIMTATWSGFHTKEYKALKGIGKTKRNLRDNMTNTELVLNSLAEVAATELSKEKNPKGFGQSKAVAVQGSNVAKGARIDLEKKLGHSVISSENADDFRITAPDTPKKIKP